jgi:hypothetical protein
MIEFKMDGTPVDIDSSYREIQATRRVGYRFLTNGKIAFEILANGKRRDRLLADYEQFKERERLLEPQPEIAQESLRETPEEPIVASVIPPVISEPEVPNENDWFDGVIKNVLPRGRDCVVELTNNSLAIVNEREFTEKDQGHSLCLKGRPCWIRIKLNAPAHRHTYLYKGLECQVQILAGDSKERSQNSGTVLNWTGSRGAARMDCGCSIQIGTASIDDQLDLSFGDRVEFDIAYNDKLHKWLGNNITVLGAEEKNV